MICVNVHALVLKALPKHALHTLSFDHACYTLAKTLYGCVVITGHSIC